MPSRQEIVNVEGREIVLSNLQKVLYPPAKFTKAQVIDYYVRISKYLLPHLKDRPVTLVRYPNGVRGEFFYEKDAPLFTPDWIERFSVPDRKASGLRGRHLRARLACVAYPTECCFIRRESRSSICACEPAPLL